MLGGKPMPSYPWAMSDVYENPAVLADYLLFHYGAADEILPPGLEWPAAMRSALDFPLRTTRHFGNLRVARALDLGCAVGRSTFELSRMADFAIGIDFSQGFISAATKLAESGELAYERLDEGHRKSPLVATPPQYAGSGKITFRHGDAMDLPTDIGTFDRIHAANLLCRLPTPERLLRRLPTLIVPGGELVIATPCTWLAEFTPPDNWPEGQTIDWLDEMLGENFERTGLYEEPFLIRETARKFQWTRSQVSVWRAF